MTSEDFGGQSEDSGNDEDTVFTFAEFKTALLQDLETFESEVEKNPDEFPDMGLSDWMENFEVFGGWS